MMADEDLVPLTALAIAVGVSHVSVWRWAKFGVKGHRLESVRRGGRVFSTREALDRFIAELNGLHGEVVSVSTPVPQQP